MLAVTLQLLIGSHFPAQMYHGFNTIRKKWPFLVDLSGFFCRQSLCYPGILVYIKTNKNVYEWNVKIYWDFQVPTSTSWSYEILRYDQKYGFLSIMYFYSKYPPTKWLYPYRYMNFQVMQVLVAFKCFWFNRGPCIWKIRRAATANSL